MTDVSTDSYVDEGAPSDDSDPVEDEEMFDFLVTTEGVYDVHLNSVTEFWKLPSGFNVSESFLEYRKKCIDKAKLYKNLEEREELALSGSLLIDDGICGEPFTV